jgi:hypothetical protein
VIDNPQGRQRSALAANASMTASQRSRNARKAARARWAKLDSKPMRAFLRQLVEAYYTQFADAPELIPDLVAAPLRWDKELQRLEAKQELRDFDEGVTTDVNAEV